MNPYAHPPTSGEVGVLLSDLGFAAFEATLHSDQGWANHTFFAGPYVVRFAKNAAEEADWRTEGLAHPHASRLGLPTPAMLFHGRDRLGRAATVIERVSGESLLHAERLPDELWQEFGAAVARLHTAPPPPDPAGVLDVHGGAPLNLGALPSSLRALGRELLPYADARGTTYVHGDATLQNLMCDDAGHIRLLDWGDAGWGLPACDFADVPVPCLEAAWAGYEEAGGRVDRELRRRTLALHLRLTFQSDECRVMERRWVAENAAWIRRLTGFEGD